jgi:hypothetical protein
MLLGALAGLVVAGCGSSDATEAASPTETANTRPEYVVIDDTYAGSTGPRVAILGDSLTWSGRAELLEELADYRVKIASGAGEGIGGGAWSRLQDRPIMSEAADTYLTADDAPDALVIALGTNNAWLDYLTMDMFEEAWPEMVADYQGDCLVVVTATESDEPAGYDPEVASAVNDALVAEADVVVDWAALDTADLEQEDHIHLLPEGLELRARLIREAIDSCGLGSDPGDGAPGG